MRLIACVFAACLIAVPAAAQDAVNAAYEAALAESPTPSLLRASQAAWLSEWTEYPDSRADLEEIRLTELRALTARDRTIRAGRLAIADLDSACLNTTMMACEVTDSGSLPMPDGTPLYFQMQQGATEEEGTGTAILIMAAEGATLTPVFWLAGPLGVSNPEIHRPEEDGGPTYVALPAYGQGTGSHWMGSMFRWNGAGAAPTEIDARTWLDRLDERLPEGLQVWKGPAFHWDWLSAESPLWQESDANCCATGGEVFVELKVEDEAIAIVNVSVQDAVLTVAGEIEPEVLSWVSRRLHCESWQAREPYDGADRAVIAGRLDTLNCATLDADEATLRAAYADNGSILALLNRAKASSEPS